MHCCPCFPCLSLLCCQNTCYPSQTYRHSLRSEALLCVALTLNPDSIFQCLLLVAETGFSTEAVGAQDYTLACLCPLGTSSLLTSAAVNYTPGVYCDWWLSRAFKTWSEERGEIGSHNKLLLALIDSNGVAVAGVHVFIIHTMRTHSFQRCTKAYKLQRYHYKACLCEDCLKDQDQWMVCVVCFENWAKEPN